MTVDFAKVFRRRKKHGAERLEADTPANVPVFCIVTPVFNGAAYIDDTIHSVLSQAGDFVVHYHVQDGGSTDDTMDRVRRWMALGDQLPRLCRKLIFTCASEPDTGMYDAINKGFARALPPGDDVVMGWIAADDRIAQGGFATMAGIRAEFPDVRFMGGRISLLGENGSIIGVQPIYPFSRRCMAAGLYDGRALPFVMQEGSFWCADLWRTVGGLDTRFRLAGDWDLWRRMAAHQSYFIVDSILGFHRRRPGQLSEQMDRYYAEVDAFLEGAAPADLPDVLLLEDPEPGAADAPPPTFGAIYTGIAAEYEFIRYEARRFRVSAHAATVVRFSLPRKRWERRDGFGTAAVPPGLVTAAGATTSKIVLLTSGLHSPEGPYPELGLPTPVRWMREPLAEGTVELDEPGQYRIVLRCRNRVPNQMATIYADGRPLGCLQVTAYGYDRDIALSVTGTFEAGSHVIGISVQRPASAERYLLLIDAVIEQLPIAWPGTLLPASTRPIALASRASDPPGRRWPAISIVVSTHDQGHLLRDTLDSILRQGYPNLELIVVAGRSCDQTAMILREYSTHLSFLIADTDHGPGAAINQGFGAATGEILNWLNSGDLLADGALHAIAHAFLTSGADIVSGGGDVFDTCNVISHRHLPCLFDGPLPLSDLLDVENRWLAGQFFLQPEVFFRRGTWDRAGAALSEQLPCAIDYDLWLRMAAQGATVRIIGSTIASHRSDPGAEASLSEAARPVLLEHASAIRSRSGLPAIPVAMPVKHRLKIVLFNDQGFGNRAGIAHRRLGAVLAAAGHNVVPLAYADTDRARRTEALSATEIVAGITALGPDLVIVGGVHAIAAGGDLPASLLQSGMPAIFYAHGRSDQFTFSPNLDSLSPTHAAPVRTAPIGIDTDAFGVADTWHPRMVLDLPQDRFVIATDVRELGDDGAGLAMLLRALELLEDRHTILLLILGTEEVPRGSSVEIRHANHLENEDVLALNYQSADLFVSLGFTCGSATGAVEAGACGVPAIAFAGGRGSEAILSGLTGLIVENVTDEALAAAIARLRADAALRRQMGIHARLHVCNAFSIPASAAAITAILANDASLGLALSPTVTLPAEAERSLHLHRLVKSGHLPEREPIHWIPGTGVTETTQSTGPGGFPGRAWFAQSPCARFMVRGEENGPHLLTLRLRSSIPGQILHMSANMGPEHATPPAHGDKDRVQVLQIPVQLVEGLNRIDMRFAPSPSVPTSAGDASSILIEDIRTRPGTPLRGAPPPDGSYDLVTGFDEEEGPYAEWGLPAAFHWALGRKSKARIYSAEDGMRGWQLRLRNCQRDQRLTIRIDNIIVYSEVLDTHVVETPLTIQFDARMDVGFHTMTFETTQQSRSGSDPRRMAFIFEGLYLAQAGGAETPA